MADNGTVFTSQEKQKFLTNRNIEWQFSLSNAPWYGGFWERLVSIVKHCLTKAVHKACLNFYELQIMLSEIEIKINSRPLNTLHDDEMYEIMAPNHFLFGRKLYQGNLNWESNSDIVEPDLPKRVEYVESLVNTFGNASVLNMLLHYGNAIKVSNQKISYFREEMILYYCTKKNSLHKNGC